MTKKILPLFVLITLAACLLSYKLGGTPTALARASSQESVADGPSPLLPAPPAEWVVYGEGNGTSAAVAVRPAGGAGVQHVVDCISATVATSGTAGGFINLHLFDGSGVTLMQWLLPVVSSQYGQAGVNLCGLNVVGTANQAMYFGFQSNSGYQSVEMIGHDAT